MDTTGMKLSECTIGHDYLSKHGRRLRVESFQRSNGTATVYMYATGNSFATEDTYVVFPYSEDKETAAVVSPVIAVANNSSDDSNVSEDVVVSVIDSAIAKQQETPVDSTTQLSDSVATVVDTKVSAYKAVKEFLTANTNADKEPTVKEAIKYASDSYGYITEKEVRQVFYVVRNSVRAKVQNASQSR